MSQNHSSASLRFNKASRFVPRLLAGGAACAMVSASPAIAQEVDTAAAEQGDRKVLEAIVVNAQKQEETLQTVPVAITVITAEEIERTFAADLTDFTGNVPNATIEVEGISPLASSFYIRGQGVQDRENFADPPVAVVINGVTQGRTTNVLTDLIDIESIEVLRGPQGTLQGRNSTGGAILVRTNKPDLDEVGGSLKVLIGEHNRRDLTGVVNVPIVEGQAGFRLAAKKTDFDGFYENLFDGSRVGGKDRLTFLPSFRYDNGKFEAIIRGEHTTIRDGSSLLQNFNTCGVDPRIPGNEASPANSLFTNIVAQRIGGDEAFFTCASAAAAERRVVNENRPSGDLNDLDVWGVTAELNYQIDDVGTITYIGDYRESDEISDIDADGTTLDLLYGARVVPHEQYSHELRFASEFSDFVDFVAGVYAFEQSYTRTADQFFGFLAPFVLQFELAEGQESKQFAAFAQANWHLSDALTLVTGARYTNEEKDAFLCPVGPTACVDRTIGVPGSRELLSDSWSDISPRIGLEYQVSDNLFTYATWAQGFQSGGFNLGASSAEAAGPFDPEQIDSFEVGAKSDLYGGRVRLNGAAFLINADDLQRLVVRANDLGGPVSTTANAAKATFWGAEFELTALVTDQLTWNTSVGYLESEYDEFCADLNGAAPNDPSLVPCAPAIGAAQPVDVSGLPLARAPNWDFRTNLVYDVPLGEAGSLSFSGDWTYTGELSTLTGGFPSGTTLGTTQFDGYVISPTRPSTNIVNLSATWRDADERVSLSAFVKNLTDETYIQRTSAVGIFNFITLNNPQTWGIEASVNF